MKKENIRIQQKWSISYWLTINTHSEDQGCFVTWNRFFQAESEQWLIDWYHKAKMTGENGVGRDEEWSGEMEWRIEWTGRERWAVSLSPSMAGCLRCRWKTIHPHEASKGSDQWLIGRYHSGEANADRVWLVDTQIRNQAFDFQSLIAQKVCCFTCWGHVFAEFYTKRWPWTPTTIPPLHSQQCWFDPSRAPPWLLQQHYRYAFQDYLCL